MGNQGTLGMEFGAFLAVTVAIALSVRAARTKGPQMAWFFGGGFCILVIYRAMKTIWPEGVPWVDQGLDWATRPPIPRPSWLTAEMIQLGWTALTFFTALMVLRLFGIAPSIKLGGAGGGGKKAKR